MILRKLPRNVFEFAGEGVGGGWREGGGGLDISLYKKKTLDDLSFTDIAVGSGNHRRAEEYK
jgi:hypothetical protein